MKIDVFTVAYFGARTSTDLDERKVRDLFFSLKTTDSGFNERVLSQTQSILVELYKNFKDTLVPNIYGLEGTVLDF